MALTLQKQTVNLVIDQGCTFEKTITAQNSSGGNVTISTGTTASKLRQSLYSSNNVFTFTTAVTGSNVTILPARTAPHFFRSTLPASTSVNWPYRIAAFPFTNR